MASPTTPDGERIQLVADAIQFVAAHLAQEHCQLRDHESGIADVREQPRVTDPHGIARHPELAIAQWAEAELPLAHRAATTVYTSGEHCPMCAAAHAWADLGRIVVATSTRQLTHWLADLGAPPAPVSPLSILDLVPGAHVDGPVPQLAAQVRGLHVRHHGGRERGLPTLH